MAFKLPKLPYSYGALSSVVDKTTMEIHHTKHHAGYTNKLNAAMADAGLGKMTIEDVLKRVSKYSPAVRNNAGGFYNHCMFWKIMVPKGTAVPSAKSKFGKAIVASFGSFENFQEKFAAAAASRFGSGWAWLCSSRTGKLFITSTPNQDNPLMDCADKKGFPIMCIDVWEHAYYLKYQNRRADYVKGFFSVVNWKEVTKRYTAACANKTAPVTTSMSDAVVKPKPTVAKKKVTAKKATTSRAKTTAKKKVTAKKATTAKAKTTAKKKVTAKKATTTKAKTTAKKAVAKKVTPKKKAVKTSAVKKVVKKGVPIKKVTAKRRRVVK